MMLKWFFFFCWNVHGFQLFGNATRNNNQTCRRADNSKCVDSWAMETTKNTISCLNLRYVKMQKYMYLGIKYWCFVFYIISIYNKKALSNPGSQWSFFDVHPIVSTPIQAIIILNLRKPLWFRGKRTGLDVWRLESNSALQLFRCATLGVRSLLWGKYLIQEFLGRA